MDISSTNLGDQYTCLILNITMYSDYSISNLNGEHTENYTLNDVTQFVMHQIKSTYFPINLHSFLPNLKLIKVRSSLVYIEKKDFQDFTKLQYLILSDNSLEQIPSDAFSNLESVIMINLRKNYLKYLNKDLFQNNIMLEKLILEGNRIQYLESDMFDHLKHLVSLDFTYNQCLTKNYSGSAIRELFKNDAENECSPSVRSYKTKIEIISLKKIYQDRKYTIICFLIVMVVLIFIEHMYFVHKLKQRINS